MTLERQRVLSSSYGGTIKNAKDLVGLAKLIRAHSVPEHFEMLLLTADGDSAVLTNDPSVLLEDPGSTGWSRVELTGFRIEDGLASRVCIPIRGVRPTESCIRGRDELAVFQLTEQIDQEFDGLTRPRNLIEHAIDSPAGALALGALAGYSALSALLVAKVLLRGFDWYTAVFFSDPMTLVQWALLASAFIWGAFVLHRRVVARLTPEADVDPSIGRSDADERARVFALFCAILLPIAVRVIVRILT